MNEAITSDIVREHFKNDINYNNINLEEYKSKNPRIDKLLKYASKSGIGVGKPDFIITYKNGKHDYIIVIECKADIAKHESKTNDKYKDYAVDGALLYASFLAKEYDVIAIGISGTSLSELKISHHLYLRGATTYTPFLSNELLSTEDYYNSYIQHPSKFNEDYNTLLAYSQVLNDKLQDNKIKESQRSLLISGILIALKNDAFKKGYRGHNTAKQLVKNMVNTIANELENSNVQNDKVENLKNAFSFIKSHSILSKNKLFLENLITEIDTELNSFIKTHRYFDVLGQFYIEFLRYANNDKGLGIVLTPPHITELFADLAEVNKDSIVIDNSCGTGGFLIAAFNKMIKNAEGNSKKILNIQSSQLIGIELLDDIYTLAITNMILHGDGKSNIHQRDCFEQVNEIGIKSKPNVGLLNPPYKDTHHELEFILNNLQFLADKGICIGIVPMSCAIAQTGLSYEFKKRLLKNHTLEAVMSMPEDLFHNSDVGTVTCIMVFKANVPHNTSNKKTWFGYWRNDGFIKKKGLGRVDYNNTWHEIKKEWVDAFINRETITDYSLMRKVTAEDEWCIESFLETDYSKLDENDFKDFFKNYLTYKILNTLEDESEENN